MARFRDTPAFEIVLGLVILGSTFALYNDISRSERDIGTYQVPENEVEGLRGLKRDLYDWIDQTIYNIFGKWGFVGPLTVVGLVITLNGLKKQLRAVGM